MKKGFTLAELMAVVVIVAIIAAIGLGGYRRTVERAKLTEGLNMAHQIAQALVRADWDRYNRCERLDTPWTMLDIDSTNYTINATELVITGRFKLTQEGFNIKVERLGREAYTLLVPIDCDKSPVKLKDQCIGNTDFCISAGFTNCTGTSCTKP